MSIVLVGLNYRTAPITLREQFSLAGDALETVLHELQAARSAGPAALAAVHECVIISTCNRLELYAVAGDPAPALGALEEFLAHLRGATIAELRPH
ncbi:MAG: glutamyl-tRNA reductase, partial [Anaerolineae bacterium]